MSRPRPRCPRSPDRASGILRRGRFMFMLKCRFTWESAPLFLCGGAHEEDDLPLRRMRGVMRGQFRTGPDPVFLELLGQLPRHAEQPVRAEYRARLERPL